MKKILFLIESLSGGGAERVLTDLVKALDKSKFDITVMTIVDTGIYINDVKSQCKYKSFLSNPNACSNYFARLLYKIKYKLIYILPSIIIYKCFIKENYDIEIAFTEGFVTKVISASTNMNSKKIAWVHTDMISNNYADNYFKNYESHINSYNIYNDILCVSKSVADKFNMKFNVKKKAIVQYNPINRELILLKSNHPINIYKNKITIVAVGRLVKQKGFDRLLKICEMLKEDGFDFSLWIIGEGEQRAVLERYINDHYLRNTIKLMGFQSNPYPYIKAADLFVCSSITEGFSTVATEAVILGKAIVATDCSGMNELLGNNEFGIITKNNCNSLYIQLKKVLSNPRIIDYYSEKAKLRSRDFVLEGTIKKIEEIFLR